MAPESSFVFHLLTRLYSTQGECENCFNYFNGFSETGMQDRINPLVLRSIERGA
jgi:hypothetical protein